MNTSENLENLPHFRRPPVSETVLGVQFPPLRDMSTAVFGAFWKELGPDWPTTNDAPPLEPASEQFGTAQVWQAEGIRLTLARHPGIRLQISNTNGDRMIQIQNGRLHYNWIRQGAEYPRYKTIRREFDQILTCFRTFFKRQCAGELSLNQWEVTYVNHIPKGNLWEQTSDWTKILRLVPPINTMECLKLETQGGTWHFEITPRRGRLHIELKHGVVTKRGVQPPGTELLVLTLTARGPISDNPATGLPWSEGMDCGRKIIVQSFFDITTENAHEKWEIVQ